MSTLAPIIVSVLAFSMGLFDSICGAMLANSVGEIALRNECLVYIVIFCCALHWLRCYMKDKLGKGEPNGKQNKDT